MKILIIHNEYCFSGGEDAVVSSEQAALSARGHTVEVYRCSNLEFSAKPAFKKILFLLSDYFFSQKTFRELSVLIKCRRPDIVHVHNIFFNISASVYAVCHKYSVPVVQTLHNYRYLCPNALFYVKGKICQRCLKGNFFQAVVFCCRNGNLFQSFWAALWNFWLRKSGLLNNIACYIASSEFSKGRFVAAGFDGSKISVKPNFVRALSLRLQEGSFVLYAGALVDYKGIDDLMQIIELSPGIPFVVAGQGPKEQELKNWLSSLDKRYVIEFKGQVSPDVLMGLLSQAAVLLFPSKCYENFPRIIVEAFACGVPVLAADTPVMQEIIVEGSGQLYSTINDAVPKLSKMFFQKKINAEAGKKAAQCYREKYTEEKNMQLLESVYAVAIEGAVSNKLGRQA